MEGRPPFWDAKARAMLGKRVLVGRTYLDEAGAVVERSQSHGVIEDADERRGFAVRDAGTGELDWLPPDLRSFQAAPPGEYTLRSTGEVVVDPDYISNWVVRGATR